MDKPKILLMALIAASIGLSYACSKDDDDSNGGTDTTGNGLPAPYSKFYNIEELYLDGTTVVIRTKDVPDHGSPFFDESDSRYEAYNGSNPDFSTVIAGMDPDLIEQDVTFRLPTDPSESSNKQATGLGPIGIALNGVLIFNQYNGANQLLDDLEFNNLDQYNGHPTPEMAGAAYHYHTEPLWLTSNNGNDALVGFLLDGFPVYGPEENGVRLTSADLDDYHGHSHATADYPDGIYHYHITDDAPWINGDGYWGTPGTVSF